MPAMLCLRLTLPTPAENVALDEALVEAAEAGESASAGGVLRLWESPSYFVVLGRSSRAEIEVHLDACQREGVPILRRPSGGGTVLAGPGCLMYAVVLDYRSLPHLRAVDAAHRFVLERIAGALAGHVPGIAHVGISDLAVAQTGGPALKVSGNALRARRHHFLYHGTLLYNFALERIGQLLAAPTRTPVYRQDRAHDEFVTNLPLNRHQVERTLIEAWDAHEPLRDWPRVRVAELVATKYATQSFATDDPDERR
jgi:lipoate-protein ligase A